MVMLLPHIAPSSVVHGDSGPSSSEGDLGVLLDSGLSFIYFSLKNWVDHLIKTVECEIATRFVDLEK